MEKIVTIAGITIDLSRIRAVRKNNFSNKLLIEYNARTEYSKSQFNGTVLRNEIVDTISHEFASSEAAQEYQIEIEECWKEYSRVK